MMVTVGILFSAPPMCHAQAKPMLSHVKPQATPSSISLILRCVVYLGQGVVQYVLLITPVLKFILFYLILRAK